jgi:hypothetical protein
MIRILILLFPILLFSKVSFADECDDVLRSVRTIGDSRKYLQCVAKQTPNGVIFAWDAIIRDKDGTPTGEYHSVPDGWKICNGENGTPDLTGKFLMGAASLSGAGETGGKANIKESGIHAHSGTTGVTRGPDHGISCSGKCSGGRTAAHSHSFDTGESGTHSHGSNLPPYYKYQALQENSWAGRALTPSPSGRGLG